MQSVRVLKRAVLHLYRHQSPSVLVPALRTVGNIVTGDDLQTQVIINCGALPCLLNLLTTSHKKSIKKEACWTISNITAGTKEQVRSCPAIAVQTAHLPGLLLRGGRLHLDGEGIFPSVTNKSCG